jgi:hypothetical protein
MTMKTKMANRPIATAIAALAIASIPVALAPALAAAPAAAASGPAPGSGLTGACNMLHDPTMLTTPMRVDSAQGNAGMFTAVAASGCS